MVTNIRLAVAALSVIFVCVIAAQIAHPAFPRSAAAQQCGDVNDDDAVTATDALAVLKEHGLKETLRRRDEPFGEGFARVDEPEGRSVVPKSARRR